MSRPKFRPGSRTVQFKHEERVFLLQWAKTLKPKTELEQRIVKRFLRRLVGENGYFPLYAPKECPRCERTIAGQHFEAHEFKCRLNYERELTDFPGVTITDSRPERGAAVRRVVAYRDSTFKTIGEAVGQWKKDLTEKPQDTGPIVVDDPTNKTPSTSTDN